MKTQKMVSLMFDEKKVHTGREYLAALTATRHALDLAIACSLISDDVMSFTDKLMVVDFVSNKLDEAIITKMSRESQNATDSELDELGLKGVVTLNNSDLGNVLDRVNRAKHARSETLKELNELEQSGVVTLNNNDLGNVLNRVNRAKYARSQLLSELSRVEGKELGKFDDVTKAKEFEIKLNDVNASKFADFKSGKFSKLGLFTPVVPKAEGASEEFKSELNALLSKRPS